MTPTEQFYVTLSDGVKREIRFSIATLKRIKAKTGKSFMREATFEEMDEDVVPTLLFEALVDKSSLNEDFVAENISMKDFNRIYIETMTAFAGSLPPHDPEAQEKN
jgi:hypothetical protein